MSRQAHHLGSASAPAGSFFWVANGQIHNPRRLGGSATLSYFLFPLLLWSGRLDLNQRPPVPQTGALTRLRHAPMAHSYTTKLHLRR
jgi:hypothetical protein